MSAFLPKRRTAVLEIGCGEGMFAASIEGTTETWGVELDSEAAHAASSRLHKVINAGFDEASGVLPRNYFDVVICNDVIEHMIDHDSFFRTIKKHISDSGVLIGSIPNVRHYNTLFRLLFSKDWRYRDDGILDRTHLRFFTEKSLRRTLAEHGFCVEELRGINSGIALGWSRWALCSAIAAYGAIVISFGSFRDIRHLQFGFRARPMLKG